jgi:hypothetical protein
MGPRTESRSRGELGAIPGGKRRCTSRVRRATANVERGDVWVPGGLRRLQSGWDGRSPSGGFDSRPSPPNKPTNVRWCASKAPYLGAIRNSIHGRSWPFTGALLAHQTGRGDRRAFLPFFGFHSSATPQRREGVLERACEWRVASGEWRVVSGESSQLTTQC